MPKFFKPVTIISATVMTVTGVGLGLLNGDGLAHAAGGYSLQGIYTDPQGSWRPYTTAAGVTTPIQLNNNQPFAPLDDQTLYWSTNIAAGYYATNGDLPVSGVGTTIGTNAGNLIGKTTSTMAVDSNPYGDPSRDQGYAYFWAWDSTTNASAAQNKGTAPATNTTTLVRFPGGATTSNGTFMQVPNPNYTPAAGDPNQTAFNTVRTNGQVYNYWSGGEAFQKTGQIYFTGGEGCAINGAFAMMIFDPQTGAYNFSGVIQPATGDDNIFGTAVTSGANGYVSSDMALDANGNAYVVVESTQAAPSWNLPAATREWLVRIVPNDPVNDPGGAWTYNLVMPFNVPAGSPSIVTAFQNGNNTWGMAFYQGFLYAVGGSGNSLMQINLMSGSIYAVGGTNASVVTNPATVKDMASGQSATVVEGTVYNDANNSGTINKATAAGVPGQTVAIYSKDSTGQYTLQGTQLTGTKGTYSFLVGGFGDYIIRVVQPNVNGMNAVQTWADGSTAANSVTAICGNVPGGIWTPAGGTCYGAHPMPSPDPALPANPSFGSDQTTQPGDMAIYSQVSLTTDQEVADADFGISYTGSTGDAPAGPASFTTSPFAPAHINGANPATDLYLGTENGQKYSTPATNGTAHNTTDDGVSISGTTIPLQGTILAASRPYTLQATVGGSGMSSLTQVNGWGTTGTTTWTNPVAWSPTLTGGTATGTFQMVPTGQAVTGSPAAQMRVQVSNTSVAGPTNTARDYQAQVGSTSTTQSWATPGEIEDYTFNIADAVYRVAANTASGTPATPFTVDGQSLKPTGPAMVVGNAKASASGARQTITATVPDDTWSVSKVTLLDTETGATVTSASLSALTTSGRNTTFSFTPQLGDDLTVLVTFSAAPDPKASTLSVPPTATIKALVDATVTVKDINGALLPGATVTFTATGSTATFPNGSTCETDDQGTCSVQVTDTKVETTNIAATVSVSGSQVPVSNSPQPIAFGPSAVVATHSDLTVTPTGPLTVGTGTANTYTASVIARDDDTNPVPNTTVSFTITHDDGSPVDPAKTVLSASSCTTSAAAADLGKCSITITSTEDGSFKLHATVTDAISGNPTDINNSPATLTWNPGPICTDASCTDTKFAVALTTPGPGKTTPLANGTDSWTGTLTAHDQYGNAIKNLTSTAIVITVDPAITISGFTNNNDGTYTMTFTSRTASDTYTATAKVNGSTVAPSPVPIPFDPSTVDAGNSTLTVMPAGPLTVGTAAANTYTATAMAMDANDNPVPGVQMTFTVTKANGDPVDPSKTVLSSNTCTTSVTSGVGRGQCSVTVTSTEAGSFKIHAYTAAMEEVTNSPATVVWNPDNVCTTPVTCPATNFSVALTNPSSGKTMAVANGSDSWTGTLKAADQYGNPVANLPATAVGFTADSQVAIANYKNNNDGTYTVTFTATQDSPDYTASATIYSSTIAKSPSAIPFGPDDVCIKEAGCDPDPGVETTGVSVTKDNQVADGTQTDQITARARDKAGNKVSGVTFQFSTVSSDLHLAALSCTTDSTGNCTVNATTTKAGAYSVKAQIGSQELNQTGSPLTLTFIAGPPVATSSTLSVDNTFMQIGGNVTAKVTVLDQYGNLVPNATVTLSVTGTPPASTTSATVGGSATTTCTTISDSASPDFGTCSKTVTDGTAEYADVHASIGTTEVKNSPQTILFGHGAISAKNSTLAVSLSSQKAGSPVTVTITARDDNNNAVTGLTADKFNVTGKSAGLPDLVLGSWTDTGNGIYTYQTTSYKVGLFTFDATVDGVHLTQNPTTQFNAGDVCVTGCVNTDPALTTRFVVGPDYAVADGVNTDTVTAYAFDTYGNAVPNATVSIVDTTTGTLAGKLTPATGLGTTGTDGTAKVTFRTTAAGQYQANGSINTLEPPATKVILLNFVPGDVSRTTSTLTVNPSSTTAGSQLTAHVETRDANGSLVGGVAINLTSDPNVTFSTSCTTAASGANFGMCDVTFTSKLAGQYDVHALLGSADISGSPARVTFTPGQICFTGCSPVDPNNVTHAKVTLDGALDNGTATDEVTVYAYDMYGNAVPGATVSTTVITSTLTPVVASGTTGGDGTFKLTYSSRTAGAASANVAINGTAPTGSPVTMNFAAGQGDPAHSSVTISPTTSQQVDSTFTLTATVHDASDQPVSGVVVTFGPASGLTMLSGGIAGTTCTTTSTGVCQVTVTAQLVGTYAISAKIMNSASQPTDINGSPVSAEFTAGPVCVPLSCTPDPGVKNITNVRVTTNGVPNDGTSVDVATVQAYDKHGNPVPNAVVASTTSDSTLKIQTTINPTNASGETTISYTSTSATAHTATVTVGGIEPKDPTAGSSPITLVFGQGIGDADHSSFTITPMVTGTATPLIVGTSNVNTYQVTATINDAFDKPVANATATFDISPNGPVWTGGQTSCQTGADGKCSVYVYSTKASSFAVTANVNAKPIGTAKSAVWKSDVVCAADCTPVDPSQSPSLRTRVEVTTDNALADGSAQDIVTLYAFDQFGNPVQGALVTSTATADPKLTIQSNVTGTDIAGVTTIWYASTVAGAHTADVRVDGKVPTKSPVTVNFNPGPASATQSTLVLSTSTASVGDAVTATITTKDMFGNKTGPVTVTVSSDGASTRSLGGTTCTTNGTETDPNYGTCTFTVSDDTAQDVNVTAMISVSGTDTPINGSPAKVTFTSGSADATHSDLSVSPTSLPAGGGSAGTATITVTARDSKDNLVANQAVNVTVGGSGQLAGGPCVTNSSGTCTMTLTDSKAETVTVGATIGGVNIKNAPANVTFTHGSPSAANSTLAVAPQTQTAGTNVTVTVTVQDALKNPIDDLAAADFTVTGKATGLPDLVLSSFTNIGNGQYTYQTTSKDMGTFMLDGTVSGVHLMQNPTVTFTAGDVCVTNCTPTPENKDNLTRFTVENDNAVANGTATDVVKAWAYDTYGNPVNNATVVVNDTTGGSLAGQLTPARRNGTTGTDGTTTVSFTTLMAGQYQVTGQIDGSSPSLTATQTLTYVPGNVDPTKSTLTVVGTPADVGTSTMTATVATNDASGNPVGGVTVSLTSTPSGVTFGDTCTTESSGANLGKCTVTLSSTVAGTYQIHAMIGTTDISGSPKSVEFTHGDPCFVSCLGKASYVEMTTNGVLDDGNAVNIATAYVYDKYGNPVPGANVATTAMTSTLTVVKGSATTGSDGTATLTYSSRTAGDAMAHVTINSTEPTGSPVTMTFATGLGDPAHSTLSISPTTSQQVRSTFTVKAAVHDTSDQPVSGVVVTFSVPANLTMTGSGGTAVTTCTTVADGTCQVSVTTTKAGTYSVGATIPNSANVATAIQGSPVSAVFTAGPSCVPTTCTPTPGVTNITGVKVTTNGKPNDGTSRDIATVNVYDKDGNPVTGAVVATSTTDSRLMTQPATGANAIAATDATGQTTIWYTSTTGGQNMLAKVTVDGIEPTDATAGDSPITLIFNGPNNGDPTQSSYVITPTGPLTVGTSLASTYTVTATINDQYKQPAAGATVSFDVTPAGPKWLSLSSCTTGADGKCSVQIYSTKAGTFSIPASLNGVSITPSQSATWSPDGVCGTECTPQPYVTPDEYTTVKITTNDAVADGAQRDIATVKAFDQYGNPVPGAQVASTSSDSGLTVQTAPSPTDGSGTTTIYYQSRVAGLHTASVTVGGKIPNGSPMTNINFTPGSADATQSTLVLSTNAATVGDVVTATITTKDMYGNKTGPVTVTVSSDGDSVRSPLLSTCVTNGTATDPNYGTCTFTVTDSTAQDVNVTATILVSGTQTPITGSPAKITFTSGNADSTHSELSVSPLSVAVGGGTAGTATITVTARDSKDNLVPNQAVNVTANGSGQLAGGPCVTNSSGTCTMTLTDDKAETVAVTAMIGGVNIKNSPTNVTFTHGSISATNSTLEVAPTTQTAGTNVTVTVTVQDTLKNPIDDLVASDFTVTGTATGYSDLVLSSFTNIGNGKYTYQTTSKNAATFRLDGTVSGVHLTQNPTVTFTAGDVCVTNCTPTPENKDNLTRFTVETDNAIANGTATDVVKAWAYDTYGNPVNTASVQVDDTTGGSLANQLTPARRNGTTGTDGTTTVSFTTLTAGQYQVTGKIDGSSPITAVQTLTFVPGNVDPTRSTLTVAGTPANVGSTTMTATVSANDASGNPVGGVTVSLSSTPTGVTFSDTCTTASTGTDMGKCTVTLTSTVAGVYQIHAKVGASEINGSPKSVEFLPLGPCFTGCSGPASHVVVTTNGALDDGSALNVVTAYVYDTYGNQISGASIATTALTPTLTVAKGTATTGSDGTATVTYTSRTAGDAQAKVTINGTEPMDASGPSPVTMTFAAGQGDPAHSTLSISPTGSQAVRSTFTVKASVNDKSDQPVSGVVVAFSVPANLTMTGSGGAATTSCTTGTDGTCQVSVTTTTAGQYKIGATIPNAANVQTAINGSPVTAEFTAGPSCVVPDCTPTPGVKNISGVVVTTNGSANDGIAKDVATVTVYDKDGNPVADAVVASTSLDTLGRLTVQPATGTNRIMPTDASGQTTIWYTSTTGGQNLQAKVTIDGIEPKDANAGASPITLVFNGPNSGDADHSSYVITPTGPLTVGTGNANAYTVTATIKDQYDQPAGGATVTFGVTPTGPLWLNGLSSCTSGADGKCSVQIYSTKAGTFTIPAAVNSKSITPTQSATWSPDGVCASDCTPQPYVTPDQYTTVKITTNDAVGDGVQKDIATVKAFDQYGNPVPGAQVASTSTDSGLIVQTAPSPTDATGMTTIYYQSKVSGPHTATVTVASKIPTGSPMTNINFTPGSADATHSTLELSASTAKAGDAVSATVTTRDANGNLVGGVSVRVSSDGSSVMTPASPATCTTSNTPGSAYGVCQVSLTDSVAEKVNVAASINVVGIQTAITGSPASVTFTNSCVPGIDPGCKYDDNVPNDHRTRVNVTTDNQNAGSGTDEATVWVFDSKGNPVAGVTVGSVPTTTSASKLMVGAGIAKTAADGTTKVQYTTPLLTPVTATATVTVNGVELVFQPQPSSALDNPAGIAANSSPVTLHFVDNTAPSAPVIDSPKQNDLTNADPVVVSGTGEPDSTVTVTDNGKTMCTTTVGSNGQWSCSASLPDGDHSIVASQTDPSGNKSPDTPAVNIKVDKTPPTKPTFTSPDQNGSTWTNNDQMPITGTGEPGAEVVVTDGAGGPTVCTATVKNDGTWTCTPSSYRFGNGKHTLTAVQTDPAGNPSQPGTADFNVKTTAPTAPTFTEPDPNSYSNNPRVRIAGKASDPGTVTVTDGPGGPVVCTATVQADLSWSCTPQTALGEGTHDLTAVETDLANNKSGEGHDNVVIKTTPPTAPTVTGPAPNDNVPTGTPTVTGKDGTPGDTITVTDETGQTLCTTTVQTGGVWSCTPDSSKKLPDGKHTISVTEKDPAGNVSQPTQVPVNIDTVAPDAPKVISPKPSDLTNQDTPNITGTGEEGATVKVTDGPGGPVVCTATVQSDKTWECTPSKPMDDGDHTLVVTQADPAGNTSNDTRVPFSIDTHKPGVPTVDTANQNEVSGTSDEPGGKVTVKDGNGATLCSTTVAADRTWSCKVPPNTPSGDITATVTTPAGTPSNPANKYLDMRVPDAPHVTAPTGGSQTNNPSPTVTGDNGTAGDKITVKDQGTGKVLCTATVASNGTWSCTPDPNVSTPFGDGPHTILVTATSPGGNESGPATIPFVVDTVPPSAPHLDPTNGVQISGSGEVGATVNLTDQNGAQIPGCDNVKVGSTGRFSCTVTQPLNDGTVIHASLSDAAGNKSDDVTATVVAPSIRVTYPSVYAGQQQSSQGINWVPGESIHVTVASTPLDLGTFNADQNGFVQGPTFTIPKDFEVGSHTITYTGSQSGAHTVTFQVVATPQQQKIPAGQTTAQTGGSVVTGMPLIAGIVGLLILAAVALLIVVARRRQKEAGN